MGIGLSNTRARLQRLYGADYRLDMANASGGGFEARLVIPFEVA
jgi:sensor histidine kinase YesM